MKWVKRLKDALPAARVQLVCMRLADMTVTHPDQITNPCFKCGHNVGVYPSGQKVLKQHPNAQTICVRCAKPKAFAIGAPAAETREEYEAERRDSKPVVDQ